MSRVRVLVYHPQQRHLVATVAALAAEGFEVAAASGEGDALSKFQGGTWDLVLVSLLPRTPQEQPWTLVLLRAGGRTPLAIPTLGRQLPLSLEGRSDFLPHVMRQLKASQENAQTGLLGQLSQVVAGIPAGAGAQPLLSGLLQGLARLIEAQAWMLVPGDRGATVRCTSEGGGLPPPLAIRMGQGTLEKGLSVMALDTASAPAEWRQDLESNRGTSAFALPLKAGGTETLGAAVFLRQGGGALTSYEVQLASLFQPVLSWGLQSDVEAQRCQAKTQEVVGFQEQLARRQQELLALNSLLQKQQEKFGAMEEELLAAKERSRSTLKAVLNFLETGDPAQQGRSDKVAHWTVLLAKAAGFQEEWLLEMACLHNLAMPRGAGVPAQGLTVPEQQLVLRHPFLAERLAESLGFPPEVRLAVRHHQENYDGSGFPDGLARDAIPLAARLFRIAHDLVELMSPGEKPVSAAEALVQIRAGDGQQYDPHLLDLLGQLVSDGSTAPSTEAIATVSHELRNPLTFLVGYSELLAAEENLPAEAKERAKDLHQEAVHMSTLVDDLLSLSRYEAKRVEFRWQEADITELVSRAVARARTKTSLHRIEVELPTGPARLRVDPDKLAQVLDNLLDNAIKYSPEGGSIRVRLRHQPQGATVSVSDQGIGIPREYQAKVFEKFYRVDSPLKHTVPGTGLGLSLCKQIIEGHSGRIWVESEPGKGSTFSFTLPVR